MILLSMFFVWAVVNSVQLQQRLGIDSVLRSQHTLIPSVVIE